MDGGIREVAKLEGKKLELGVGNQTLHVECTLALALNQALPLMHNFV